MSYAEKLLGKIENRTAVCAVIGLGYVGLPLAVEMARAGLQVWGIDKDSEKILSLKGGISYIPDVPNEQLSELVETGMLKVSTDFSILSICDTINICVPTPLRKTRDPDISYIVNALDEIREYLHSGILVILESTTYPGTTDEIVIPKLTETGMVVGKDLFVAFSPERVDPGNPEYHTGNIPKVVGGVTPSCIKIAAALYGCVVAQVHTVSSTRVAEMVKLLENTFRSINIGMVNELALMCDQMGINVWEVIDGAATKPFGYMPFYPGPGLGGHCIPIDPFYLSWKARSVGFEARFIELAGQVNQYMPQHVLSKAGEALNSKGKAIKDSKIVILGVAYKKNVGDMRESPAIDVIGRLLARGADISFVDPYVPALAVGETTISKVDLSSEVLANSDLLIIITDHDSFDYRLIEEKAPLVLDTRNALKGKGLSI